MEPVERDFHPGIGRIGRCFHMEIVPYAKTPWPPRDLSVSLPNLDLGISWPSNQAEGIPPILVPRVAHSLLFRFASHLVLYDMFASPHLPLHSYYSFASQFLCAMPAITLSKNAFYAGLCVMLGANKSAKWPPSSVWATPGPVSLQ